MAPRLDPEKVARLRTELLDRYADVEPVEPTADDLAEVEAMRRRWGMPPLDTPADIAPPAQRWQDAGAAVDDPDDVVDPGDIGWAALGRLFELLEERRPAWQADALCLEYPELPWFPTKGQSVDECRAVCDRCLVADECASYAVDIGAKAGIWAGKSTRTRKRPRVA